MSLSVLHVTGCVTCYRLLHVTGCQPTVLGGGDSGSPDGAVRSVPLLSRPHHVRVCVTCYRLCYMLQVVNLLCWAVATAAALTVLYGLYHCYQGHTMSLSVAALYNATFRSVWSVTLAWVIFACVTGNGG